VNAVDPDGDTLFFHYTAETGTVTADPATPSQATYVQTATASGSDRLTVTVTDTRNASAQLTRNVPLQGNRGPTVTLTSIIDSCHPPCRITYTAEASDPDGDELHYLWSGCTSGSGRSAPCFLVAPGEIKSAVTVTDSQGGVTTVSATAQGTNHTPTIQFRTDVVAGEQRLLVFENDADDDRMECGWHGDCRCMGSVQSFNLLCSVPNGAANCFQRFFCIDPFGALGEHTFTVR
jgi:hypothetical protein